MIGSGDSSHDRTFNTVRMVLVDVASSMKPHICRGDGSVLSGPHPRPHYRLAMAVQDRPSSLQSELSGVMEGLTWPRGLRD